MTDRTEADRPDPGGDDRWPLDWRRLQDIDSPVDLKRRCLDAAISASADRRFDDDVSDVDPSLTLQRQRTMRTILGAAASLAATFLLGCWVGRWAAEGDRRPTAVRDRSPLPSIDRRSPDDVDTTPIHDVRLVAWQPVIADGPMSTEEVYLRGVGRVRTLTFSDVVPTEPR